MEFFAEIVKSESAWNTKGRNIIVSISKKEKDEEYWPRLLKSSTKNHRIQIDWSKWVEEDELAGAAPGDSEFDADQMQGFGGGGMPGMGGMGGMGGMEQMMAGMGGMGGGMGGMPPGMDFAKMM